MKKYIFLDRDGTIIKDKGYTTPEQSIEFLPQAVNGMRKLQSIGYRLIIITNQSAIGRGILSEKIILDFHRRLSQDLLMADVIIDAIYFCPHDPNQTVCSCRKPNIGLIRRAEKELAIDAGNHIVIGDRDSDIQLGINCGFRTFLIEGDQYEARIAADFSVKNLLKVADIVNNF